MIEMVDIAHVLFLDIECVCGKPKFEDLRDDLKALWGIKARSVLRKSADEIEPEEIEASYSDKAAIFAEFGKIVCISVGIVVRDPKTQELSVRLKSFASKDEKELLQDFVTLIDQYYNNPHKHFLCGHNIKEFDIPYICRRMVIHQMALPPMLNLSGKKPWETKHLLDTMELWKFGDRKNFTSLKLLAAILDFPSPKDDIDGSEVGRVFWEEDDLPRISLYCEKDVLATIQLFLRYKRMPILTDEQVIHVQ